MKNFEDVARQSTRRGYGSSACFTFVILVAIAMAFSMTGCATTYKVKPDLIQNFQEPQVPADKTGVYLIRGSKFVGGGRGLWVAVNDAVVADLANSSHVYLELDAGLNTVHFVQAKAGFGYLAVDNKPGELLYAKFDYAGTNTTDVLEKALGQTMVVQTKAVQPLPEKRVNDAYDNLMVNPGVLQYPIMKAADDPLTVDADHAVVRLFRRHGLIDTWAFDVWSQDGYLGSTKGKTYFSVKLKPGRHEFVAVSEHFAVLEADLEANKTYAVELSIGMGWNQAHVKLLPIDLSKDSGVKQVKGWMETLTLNQIDPAVIDSAPVAERIKMGRNFLVDVYQKIANGELDTRKLPANFGQ